MSSAYASKWVPKPDHVTVRGAGLPLGFRASAGTAGIKASGRLDLAILTCDGPKAASAIRQTRSGAAAAPVLVNRAHCLSGGLTGVVVNSGNANAGTGEEGYQNAIRMQSAAAAALSTEPAAVAVCSTGVIGQQLDIENIEAAIPTVVAGLSEEGDSALAEAILTTDKGTKRIEIEVQLEGGTVSVTAQAKGAGMIQPAFATLLCFVQTDAEMTAETCDLLLGATVKRSFERISVDGQLSTNDCVLLMSSGASGVKVEPESENELKLGEAIDSLLRHLALEIVSDGEGAVRVGRVVVEGGDDSLVEHVARTVAGSPLVKTALHGGDPNWGRILQAVGMALPDQPQLVVDIEIEGMLVCSAGAAVDCDLDALSTAAAGSEVEYLIRLPGSGSACELFFSDLSHQYVTINSEYTT